MAQELKNICGQCNQGFASEQEYLDHTCATTGFTPQDPEHLGPEFVAASQAALERGAKRAELEEAGKTPEEAIEATRDIGSEVK